MSVSVFGGAGVEGALCSFSAVSNNHRLLALPSVLIAFVEQMLAADAAFVCDMITWEF